MFRPSTPRLLRALIVLGIFTLMAVVSTARFFLATVFVSPGKRVPLLGAFATLFLKALAYYLAWAAVTPGILWLGRRVPFSRGRWLRPLVFHACVILAAGGPFFFLRLALSVALGNGVPTLPDLSHWWLRFLLHQALAIVPFYAILLGLDALLRSYREYQGKELQAVDLERSLAAAQLDTLRMKLQPHFLFNTLSTIGSLSKSGETEAIGRVVERLATLLRLSMSSSGREFVTVEEEFRFLGEYLSIESIRFRGRLRVVPRIEAGSGTAVVPNLILQPLVENAIEHGLAGMPESSLLELVAARAQGQLRLVIRDNGPGVPPGWSLASAGGRGLRNVEERLRAIYGIEYSFDLRNGETGGAVAEIRLPFREAEAGAGEERAWTPYAPSSWTTSRSPVGG